MSENVKPEKTEREITIERALTAARLAGSAEAMKHNLTLIGADSTLWFEESKTWMQRRNDIINSLPSGIVAIRQLATAATHNAFEQNRIDDLSIVQPEEPVFFEEAA